MVTPQTNGAFRPGNRASAAGVFLDVQRKGSGERTGTEERKRDNDRLAPAVRAVALVLLAAYLSLVGWLMLRPLSVTWVYATNFRPFATIHRVVLADPLTGARTIAEGLLLLAPLGVLLPAVSGKITASTVGSLIRTVFLGAAVSGAIECLQTTVPGRVFDVDSLLLNTAGVALAHLAVVPAVRARLRRRGPRPPRDKHPERQMPRATRQSTPYGLGAGRGGVARASRGVTAEPGGYMPGSPAQAP